MTSVSQSGPQLADAFDRAARHYDLLVALSPGYHRQLRGSARRLVAALPPGSPPGGRADLDVADVPAAAAVADVVLDLGCGTGASTRALADALAAAGRVGSAVVGVDASAGMIEQAKAKSWPGTVSFHCTDAQEDLRQRADESVSGAFAAYLLRNVPDRDGLLAELARVLRPGAPAVIHEYSVAGSARARVVWEAVCRGVIIPSAYLTDRDVSLYRYLRESVVDFDSIPRLVDRLEQAGLREVRTSTFPGWEHGIVHTVVAVRR